MTKKTELVMVGQTQIEATIGPDGEPYANLRRLCEETLNLDYSSQRKKLVEARWATVVNITTVGSDGKRREMAFISANTIPMWLATINAKKVAPDVRPAMHVIQDECRDVLHQHFCGVSNKPVQQQLMDMQMSISELQNKFVSLVERMIDGDRKRDEMFSELMQMVRRIDDRTKGKREDVSAEHKRSYIICIDRFYKGQCPCCQRVEIINDGKRIPDVSQVDHFHHRSMNGKEFCWLVCKSCNRKLRNRKPDGYWHQSMLPFQNFQRLLHQDDQPLLFDGVA